MRSDMQKIIVERPRRGGRGLIHRPHREGEEKEGYPKLEGMKRRWKDHKELSDNLNPLWRYLDKQVGRPWDSVWSEISAMLDFRSVLGFHVKSHIDQHVERHVVIRDGKPYSIGRFNSGWTLVHGLYVDPRDGILRCHGSRFGWHNMDGTPYRKPIDPDGWKARKLDDGTEARFIDGAWYRIERVPAPKDKVAWTALGMSVVHRRGDMIERKRQLNRREIKAHGLGRVHDARRQA